VKVRLKINRVEGHHRQRRGEVIEVSTAEGRTLIATGRAELVEEAKKEARK
jgi:hypothetical protein